jgi:lipopolysaccharide export system protein LptC
VRPFIEKSLVLGALGVFAAATLWLQIQHQEDTPKYVVVKERHDPDYYIENFVQTGTDETGELKYTLKAERLVHYPDDNTALLDKPHLIQYEQGKAPTHTTAESGWVSADGDEVLLTGNVRITRGKAPGDTGGVATTDKLKLRLKKGTLKNNS